MRIKLKIGDKTLLVNTNNMYVVKHGVQTLLITINRKYKFFDLNTLKHINTPRHPIKDKYLYTKYYSVEYTKYNCVEKYLNKINEMRGIIWEIIK